MSGLVESVRGSRVVCSLRGFPMCVLVLVLSEEEEKEEKEKEEEGRRRKRRRVCVSHSGES